MAITPKLSLCIGNGTFNVIRSLSYKFVNYLTSAPVWDSTIYSAFVVERALSDCFFDCQVTTPTADKKQVLVIDFFSSVLANPAFM